MAEDKCSIRESCQVPGAVSVVFCSCSWKVIRSSTFKIQKLETLLLARIRVLLYCSLCCSLVYNTGTPHVEPGTVCCTARRRLTLTLTLLSASQLSNTGEARTSACCCLSTPLLRRRQRAGPVPPIPPESTTLTLTAVGGISINMSQG